MRFLTIKSGLCVCLALTMGGGVLAAQEKTNTGKSTKTEARKASPEKAKNKASKAKKRLVHHWKFDEQDGEVAKDSVGKNHLNLLNWQDSETPWSEGFIRGAIKFSKADHCALTQNPVSFPQYTISFWLRMTDEGGVNPRIVGPVDGRHHWVIVNNEFDQGVGFYKEHGRCQVQCASPPAEQTWEHYAVTVNLKKGVAQVFRNGRRVAKGVFHDEQPTLRWVLGHNGDDGNHVDTLRGKIDDLRIYNYVLGKKQIQELMTRPSIASSKA